MSNYLVHAGVESSITATDAQAWLVLAVGENRQHGGNDGYDDDPASHYSWDSTVPSHAKPDPGDVIVLWDKQTLLGASVIEAIQHGVAHKTLYRCPNCGKAGIKARKTVHPRFKCYKCHAVFNDPVRHDQEVRTYRSTHDVGWVDLNGALPGSELRELCVQPDSQLSLRPLRWDDFLKRIGALSHGERLTVLRARARKLSGGHTVVTVRARIGQGGFRRKLLRDVGAVCAFTGPAPVSALEACHLYSYAEVGEHDACGGLLLRRDVHRLFDLGHLAVNPDTMTIDVAPSLSEFPAYASLAGAALTAPITSSHARWLRDHWTEHRLESTA